MKTEILMPWKLRLLVYFVGCNGILKWKFGRLMGIQICYHHEESFNTLELQHKKNSHVHVNLKNKCKSFESLFEICGLEAITYNNIIVLALA